MKVHYGLEELSSAPQTVVTIGAFDGLHLAHKKIISLVIQEAKRLNVESVVVTFWPLPKVVLNPEIKQLELLSTMSEKEVLLSDLGVDHLYIIPFTTEFSKKTANDFVVEILINRLHAKKIILGYDHHFGLNREGGLNYLKSNEKQFGIDVEAIEEQIIQNSTISSTQIRNAIKEGNIENANVLLGYNYSFGGQVVKGNQLGRTIGFPTANITIEEEYKLIPGNGVYAVKVKFEERWYLGMMNIGIRPTLDGVEKRIEVNIFDFDQQIYGCFLAIQVCFRLRNEQKFESLEALKNQIEIDRDHAKKLLSSQV